MKYLIAAVCLLLTSCSASRQLEHAQQVIAQHQLDTPPEQQLSELVAQHPELQGKTVRVVHETDTVRVPGATITVRIPVVSTPGTDNLLIDSLMRSAARQLHAKDSTAFVVRLRAILAARPRLSTDTLVQHLGPLTVRTWVDRQGSPHTTVVSAPQKFAFEKQVTHTGPVLVQKEMTTFQRIWLFIKDATGLIVAVVIVSAFLLLFFLLKRRSSGTT